MDRRDAAFDRRRGGRLLLRLEPLAARRERATARAPQLHAGEVELEPADLARRSGIDPWFLDQLQQVQKMGPIGQLVSMIPGMGDMGKEAQAAVDRGDLRRTEAIIRSMTKRERRDPGILNGSRRRRIAT